jgi:hypothetical protein
MALKHRFDSVSFSWAKGTRKIPVVLVGHLNYCQLYEFVLAGPGFKPSLSKL